MQTSGELGIRPAHMPQAAPPSPAALPRASGIRFWKPSLQAGSLTLPGTLEAASLPLPIPPTLTLARLAQSATLEGYLLLFCVFFSWAQNKAGRVPKNGCSGGPAWRCRRWRCMSDPHTIHRFSPAVRQKCFLPLFFFTKRHTLSLLEYISFKFKDDRILPEMMDLLSWNQKL